MTRLKKIQNCNVCFCYSFAYNKGTKIMPIYIFEKLSFAFYSTKNVRKFTFNARNFPINNGNIEKYKAR